MTTTNLDRNQVQEKILKVVSSTFRIPANETATTLSMGGHPSWDSLGHMELIMNLENEFGISFPLDSISELVSVQALTDAICLKAGQA